MTSKEYFITKEVKGSIECIVDNEYDLYMLGLIKKHLKIYNGRIEFEYSNKTTREPDKEIEKIKEYLENGR